MSVYSYFSRLGSCPALSNSSSMTQTELLQELTNDCRYDKMARPSGESNITNPITVYTRAYIYTIKSNMVKTLVIYIIIIYKKYERTENIVCYYH